MDTLFLLKYGEIAIKGNNQKKFIYQLEWNLKNRCKGIRLHFHITPGRFFIRCPESDTEKVRSVLEKTFGLTWFMVARESKKEMSDIEAVAIGFADEAMARPRAGKSFKIAVRRSDKSFPLRSYEIACRLGDLVCEKYPDAKVNLTNPDWIVSVEIRDKAYVYGNEVRGLCGLPAGCAGRGLLLLSGGIDSPVAGFLLAKRGLSLDALYFNTPPFTSGDAEKKVRDIAAHLGSYIPGMSLGIVPFTDAQMKIKETAKEDEVTLLSRASMMRIADRIAKARGELCLVTGESLSQVASQTLKGIHFTGSFTDLPVFRPLIGTDKEEIVNLSRKIGTFDISIRPFADCCTIFAPAHPLIYPDFAHMRESFALLGIDSLLDETAKKTAWTKA
jgi:thiamine biosynthesis protein ThiI